MEVIRGRHLTV